MERLGGAAAWCCGVSAGLLCAEQSEGVADALFEEFVGESPVGQGAGELQRPDHHGVDAEDLLVHRARIGRCQASGDTVDDGEHAVGVRLLGLVRAAPDLIEECGGGAAVVGTVAVLGRQIPPYDLLESGDPGAACSMTFAYCTRNWSATAAATRSSLDSKWV